MVSNRQRIQSSTERLDGVLPPTQSAEDLSCSHLRIQHMTTVGIVEDDDAMRNMLVELFNSTPGYKCICACCTVKDALIEIPKARPHVVLMDIYLPDGSGIVCTARLTEKLPELQIIIITVYRDTELIFDALKAGACGYILKRFKPEEIIRAVAEVRAGGAPMTPEIARMVVRSFQTSTPKSELEGLTAREAEILTLVAKGLSNKEIAARLGVSHGTVRNHLANVFKKLHVQCRTEAAMKYLLLKYEGKSIKNVD